MKFSAKFVCLSGSLFLHPFCPVCNYSGQVEIGNLQNKKMQSKQLKNYFLGMKWLQTLSLSRTLD